MIKYYKIRVFSALIILLVSPSICLSQQIVNGYPVTKKTDNKTLLNLWGQQPEHIRMLYDSAFKVLSHHPDASFADLSSSNSIAMILEKNKVVHWGGPMLGQISSDEVSIWIRTTRPAKVEAFVMIDGKEKEYGPVHSSFATDLSAIIRIYGLEPDKQYDYRILIDGIPVVSENSKFSFRTTGKDKFIKGRITFGSCFHRWGLGNEKQVNTIIGRNPDAMLFMGDVAVQDRMNDQGLHRADYLLRDFIPAWQKLVATVPVYDTWDDHDYFNDDLAGIPEGFSEKDKENVWEVYRYAWNNPSYGFGDNGKGVFFRTRIGPADVIMVDDRYFRKGVKGSFLGREQLDWLKTNLAQCKGPFIILSCGTMWSDYVDEGKDSWGVNDPEGREELFNFIESKDISGVLLISGDRHGARGFTIPRPSGFSFYEFEVASLGGRVGPPVSKPEWKNQFYGISGKFAFGEFTFTGSKKDPEVVFRLIDDDGAIINETRLKKSQLTPSNFRNKVLISNEK